MRSSVVFDDLKVWREKGLVDDRGVPRLEFARKYFLEDGHSFDELESLFTFWSELPEYLVLQGSRDSKDGSTERKYIARKCAKRGNDVYLARVRKKLDVLKDVEDVEFFKASDKEPKSPCLFVTLTYDAKRCEIEDAYQGIRVEKTVKDSKSKNFGKVYKAHSKGCGCISCDWNRFLARVRRRYGKISVLRSWETYYSGYPHIHALILFEAVSFNVFGNREFDEKKGEWVLRYRIQEKGEFEPFWHSFIDVEAVRTFYGAMSYVTKEILKTHISSDTDKKLYRLTLAFLWLFHKQAFSISGKFIESIRNLHNSNNGGGCGQVDLGGIRVDEGWVWRLLNGRKTISGLSSVFTARVLGLKGSEWYAVIPNELARELKKIDVVGGVHKARVSWNG